MNFNKCSMSQEGILLNLSKGLDSEVRARDLCRELLKVLDNENDQRIVKKIMEDEERHIKITEDLISVTKAFYLK